MKTGLTLEEAQQALCDNIDCLGTEKLPRREKAVLDTPFPKGSGIRRFVRGKCGNGHVSLPEGHSSGVLRSLMGCSCLVDIPAGSGPLAAGETVDILML